MLRHRLPLVGQALKATFRYSNPQSQPCLAGYATATRSSTQFTFSTKFPRKPSKAHGKGGKKSGSYGKPRASSKLPGLALPARLRLATFKHTPSSSSSNTASKPSSVKKPGVRPVQSPAAKTAPKAATGRVTTAGSGGSAKVGQGRSSTALRSSRDLNQEKIKNHATKFALAPTQFDKLRPESLASLRERVEDADFDTLGLHPDVVRGITEDLGLRVPTEIQTLGIQAALTKPEDHLLFAAETGCGKTLAYLLPIISHLKHEEDALKAVVPATSSESVAAAYLIPQGSDAYITPDALSSIRKLRRPRAVIIVPSRELVVQVSSIAKSIAHQARLRVVAVHGGLARHQVVANIATKPVDILVTTPSSLLQLCADEEFSLSQTRHIAVDEADTMFDQDFGPELSKIISEAKGLATKLDRSCRFIFVSATLPRTVIRALDRDFSNITRITTPNLHRTLPRLKQSFLRVGGSVTKQQLCLDILKRAVIDDDRIIIFCNRRKTCQALAEMLRDKGFDAADISSNVHIKDRTRALKKFAEPALEGASRAPMLVVATDIASRGLDTTYVGHVVLYDFPQTAIDYLHRAGRTARNGAKGRATSIVGRKDENLANMIQTAVRLKHVLA